MNPNIYSSLASYGILLCDHKPDTLINTSKPVQFTGVTLHQCVSVISVEFQVL